MKNILVASLKKLDEEIDYYTFVHNDSHPYLIMNRDTLEDIIEACGCSYRTDKYHCSLYQGCPIAICDSVKYGYVEVR